jgi:TRAP transporter TAXI family solute receptor
MRPFERAISVILFSVVALTAGDSRLLGAPITITLSTGEASGYYYRLGQAITEAGLSRGLVVQTIASNGSAENVGLLRDGKVDFALVQSDITQRALHGHDPFQDPIESLRLVEPLFAEAVHIIVRSDLYIFTVPELRGKKVSIGPHGSGTDTAARAVLEASGVALEEVQLKHLSSDSVVRELQNETIDAAVLTSAIPNAIVRQALHLQEARLLLPDVKTIDRLANTLSYSEAVIPAGTYEGQADSLPAVGLGCLMLTRKDVDAAKVNAIRRLLLENQKSIETRFGSRLALLGTVSPKDAALPLHEGIARASRLSLPAFPPLLVIPALGVFLGLAAWYFRRKFAAHGQLVLAAVILIGVWLSSAFTLYLLEHNVNENFRTIRSSLWSLLVYVSGGLSSRAPITRQGEVVAIVAIVGGVGTFAWFVGALASQLVAAKLSTFEDFLLGRWFVRHHHKDHIVVVNWSHRSEEMIEQLHGPDIHRLRAVVVVSEEDLSIPNRPAFEGCFALKGDPREFSTLDAAGVQRAHSVVIISAWPGVSQSDAHTCDVADAKTLMTILAIRRFCAKEGTRQVPISAEILSSYNVDSARGAGDGGPTELVCTERLATQLLTQCAASPGIAALYEDLLTFDPGTDEIYQIDVPDECIGMRFEQAVTHFVALGRRDKEASVLPIGVRRNEVTHLNPPEDQGGVGTLVTGDRLFVIADHEESHRRK